MTRREKISGNAFWTNVEEAMTRNQQPVKEWTFLWEVNWANREVRT